MQKDWDLIIIGGGITGAGIFNLAATLGISVLMLEKEDFSSGTSSKSSKLVHGGLRYLKQAQFGLTRESVVERERLLREAPGLVMPLQFAMPIYKNLSPSKLTMDAGLTLYSMLAGKKDFKYLKKNQFLARVPELQPNKLKGGFLFSDAQVDDSRLVLRLIFEAFNQYPTTCKALNYHQVQAIERDEKGNVRGVSYLDRESGIRGSFSCRTVINASGAWSEQLHPLKNSTHSERGKMHIRPLRGSHLVFPFWKLPIGQAVSFLHPSDGRPVFLLPWEGVTLLGTTDLDHQMSEDEPRIKDEEQTYLLNALKHYFPHKNIRESDILCTFSGLRPVLSAGNKAPSKESRESEVWSEKGLISITGGKLTTFRKLAEKALRELAKQAMDLGLNSLGGALSGSYSHIPVFNPPEMPESTSGLPHKQVQRILGRYGSQGSSVLSGVDRQRDAWVPGTTFLWSELTHAAQNEQVKHLDDLLLRRTRLGISATKGGLGFIDEIRMICRPLLGWDEKKWDHEINRYRKLWDKSFSACPGSRKGLLTSTPSILST